MNKHLKIIYLLMLTGYLVMFSQMFSFGEKISKKANDRFAGSEAVGILDHSNIKLNYTQEEVSELYKGKKLEDRKVFQELLKDKGID